MTIFKVRKDANSPWEEIGVLVGPPGADYILTEEDKNEIAAIVLALLPSSEEVSY